MMRIRIEKPKPRDRHELDVLPLDPRDPDVVRAKALMRAAHAPERPDRPPATRRPR